MSKPNPNQLCPCGSGKQYKHCCLPVRPREVSLIFQVPETTKVDGIVLGPDGSISLVRGGHPIQLSEAAVEFAYSRSKRRKVLFRADIDPAAPKLDPHTPLLTYNVVYAVDTNTIQLHGERVSVACAVQCLIRQENGSFFVKPSIAGAMELRNVSGDPERVAWRLFCQCVSEHPQYRPTLRVAMIVDSSLDSLRDFNTRSVPVIDDWFLPPNFTLLYATADAATTTIGNRLMRTCDKNATQVLELIRKARARRNLHEAAPGAPYSHYRNWTKK